jgi:hypothetical protein
VVARIEMPSTATSTGSPLYGRVNSAFLRHGNRSILIQTIGAPDQNHFTDVGAGEMSVLCRFRSQKRKFRLISFRKFAD